MAMKKNDSSSNEERRERKKEGYFEQMAKHMRVPSGCAACGGPYPMCKDGCPVFDNE